MIKVIKSMLYRTTHDIFFYIAVGFCICTSLLVFNGYGKRMKNHVPSQYDKNVIVNFEQEDPVIAYKQYFSADSYYHMVPGGDLLYRDSLNNIYAIDCCLNLAGIFILIFHVLYVLFFYGEMYTKGAIRNMIAAGATKRKVFLSSLLMNAFHLFLFSLLSFIAVLISAKVNGCYPIINLPSLATMVLAAYLVGLTLSSLIVLVVFIVQRPFRSLLVIVAFAVIFSTFSNIFGFENAFLPKYEVNNTSFQAFMSKSKEKNVGFEWYMPVNDFNMYGIKKADGTWYSDFMTDRPNPDYPGDFKSSAARLALRLNIVFFPMELAGWGQNAMFRDGVFFRYIAVSSAYIIVLTAVGSVVVKKRNII